MDQNKFMVKIGDVVEYQNSCWIITAKEHSIFNQPPVYRLVRQGDPNNVHMVPRIAFTRVGPWC
jgi:hypothetical protein